MGKNYDNWKEMSEFTKDLVRRNFNIKEGSFNKTQLQKDLTNFKQRIEKEARIDELTEFEPLQQTHENCADPYTCIGYQNAVSDFDNEKEIRLAQLKGDEDE